MYGSRQWTGWVEKIQREQWRVYRRVLEAALARATPFSVGGAFATATHTGQWRGTNDMDLYVEPGDRHSLIALLGELGLHDVQEKWPYEGSAIYRAMEDGAIVELIWGMKNHRAWVDSTWVNRGEVLEVDGLPLRVTPPEEMIWPKLYVMSRERCDWPDVLNMIHFCGDGMHWQHLLDRLGEDTALLSGALNVLSWISPLCVSRLPAWLLDRVGVRTLGEEPSFEELRARAYFLRQDDWFGELQRRESPRTAA